MTKILVIEDEPTVRENIMELLDAEGFDASAAENGSVGLNLAQQQLPDLILCDVLMPELDGYGVLSALRSQSVTANIPFIFLTAKAAKTDFSEGIKLGANAYLTKPFTLEELLDAIAVHVEIK
ncbi:MAG TPA: response regulator [Cyanobacteria bacterium UBA12227]|nr:response regulator [Cyanobacteria bacterium UBA12227]HAX86270.1 response regulator [Cyanobacteria bacterium UBA11370]HBY79392.1 response regulator [Cyanobacteria bacterium UBA11148]